MLNPFKIKMALKQELDQEKLDPVSANNDWVYYLNDLRQFQASDPQLCSDLQQTLWDVGRSAHNFFLRGCC
jgi:hypothetical protein